MKYYLIFLLSVTIVVSMEVYISKEQAHYIANKVWQNEGNKKEEYLICWNDGEDFLSVGIGHFIWFRKNSNQRFYETFPNLLSFIEKNKKELPSWLKHNKGMPWKNREEFLLAKKNKSKKYKELLQFLQATIPEQIAFMAQRFAKSLKNILNNIKNPKDKLMIKRRFYEVMYYKNGKVNEKGLYALLDYTNFKGEGTYKSERYKGEGWGLLQVLYNMDDKEKNKTKAFALSASKILAKRILNSPKKRNEAKWQAGWEARLKTYW